ncbi:MAG: SH3 domain-containing protein [Actinomycetota bacterium]
MSRPTNPDTSPLGTPVRLAAIALAIAIGAVACSSGGGDTGIASSATAPDATTAASTDGATASTTASDESTTSTTAATGDDGSTTSTTEAASTSTTTATDLAGEPWDGFAQAGEVLSVFGVDHDDVLNVRAGPGTDTEIVATAAPTADDLVATGRARQLPSSFWYEVQLDGGDGVSGWVSVAFVAFAGATDDATAEFLAANGPASAETLVDLADAVGTALGSEDPASTIVQTVAPTVGDLGEITVDVVGLGDDAGAGYRLHLFAEENANGETWDLRTIERTSFCTRGVSGEFCV